ncbi:hypothetical protein HHI36_008329, partial [Cryptolaemus montrouzieri]
ENFIISYRFSFTGQDKTSLPSFLIRIDELCKSRTISKDELFSSASDIFSGCALLWFRTVKDLVYNWDALVTLLKKEYLPADYKDKVWEKKFHRQRVILARLLEKEINNPPSIPRRDPKYSFDSEQQIIKATFDKITEFLDQFSEGKEENSCFIRIMNYITHISDRVDRIVIPDDTSEYITKFKSEAHASATEFEALLHEKVSKVTDADHSTLKHHPSVAILNDLTRRISLFSIDSDAKKSVPVYKWNISFNGQDKTNLPSFLIRIDELCKSRNISKDELFSSASDILTGCALF